MAVDLPARVARKLTRRILPFVMLLYFVSFLDRVNVGFAALSMNKALGLTPAMFGLGGGVFFFGYFLFEVPSNISQYISRRDRVPDGVRLPATRCGGSSAGFELRQPASDSFGSPFAATSQTAAIGSRAGSSWFLALP